MDTPPADCFANLIGLSAAGSTYFPLPPGAGESVTLSRSGLFLDIVEGLLLCPAAGQSAASDLYARLDKARALAMPAVRMALDQRRRTTQGLPRFAQRGTLGGLGNGSLMSPGSAARMTFYTNAARFGVFRVLSLQLYTDLPVTNAPVLFDGVLVGTLTAGGTGGSFVPLVVSAPLHIPFDGNRHTLEVTIPAGVRVRSNNMWCAGCMRSTPWGMALARNLNESLCASATGGGLAVLVQEECTEPLDSLCYALSVDAQPNGGLGILARSIAFSALYKAAEYFTDSLLIDAQVSRYTMLEPKALGALASKYQAQAESHLAWLAGPDALGSVRHPCFCGLPERLSNRNTL